MMGPVRLDWVDAFEFIDSYRSGDGGVFHVRGHQASALNAFVQVLRSDWNSRTPGGACAIIDPTWSETHYPVDVMTRVAKAVGLDASYLVTPPTALGEDALVNATILQGTRAASVQSSGITQNVNTTIHLHGAGVSDDVKVARALQWTKAALAEQRLLVIVVEPHRFDDSISALLYHELWSGGLDQLLELGLVVCVVRDLNEPLKTGEYFPPSSADCIDLPSTFDLDPSRSAALSDLADFALAQEWCEEGGEAATFARTLIDAADTVSELYDAFAKLRAKRSSPSPRGAL
jgi:hypothetical protein